MVRKLTITADEDAYEGPRTTVAPRRIGRFLNDLAKPPLEEQMLLEGYRRLAADGVQEAEAEEWCEALVADALGDGSSSPNFVE